MSLTCPPKSDPHLKLSARALVSSGCFPLSTIIGRLSLQRSGLEARSGNGQRFKSVKLFWWCPRSLALF